MFDKPVSRKDIPRWKFWICCSAFIDDLNIQKSEHAPVFKTDDASNTGAGAGSVSLTKFDVLNPGLVERKTRLYQPWLLQSEQ